MRCNAPRSRERRVLLSDNSKHVPKAAQLLCDGLPGTTLDDLVKEYLKAPAMGSKEVYVCKRPCFVQLGRIVKLEEELEAIKQEMVGRMKKSMAYRELRKRIAEPPATPTAAVTKMSDSTISVTLRAVSAIQWPSVPLHAQLVVGYF